jgi:hypothetical protein
MRYERKFRIVNMSVDALRQLLHLHPAAFQPLFPDRQINNVYLDTPQFATWNENIFGVNQRKKYRIRWYGEQLTTITKPKLELKIKHNELGRKESYILADFELQDVERICAELPHLDPRLPALKPSLINTYRRSYLRSFDGYFRITIDRDMRFYPFSKAHLASEYPLPAPMHDPALILEVKYEVAHDHLVEQITQHLPFRQSRHSKYVMGVLLAQ